jgi:cytochrome c peroxidase
MARTTLIVLAVVCLTVLGVVMITKGQEVGPTATIYNPYSPGILPADLDSEIARVLREIDVIQQECKGSHSRQFNLAFAECKP